MRNAGLSMLIALVLAGCAAPGGPYPSLQPRTGEQTDPRVTVERPRNDRPVTAALASRLGSLVAQARSGDAAFAPLMDQAERLAGSAGGRGSEGWIAAQQALSAAVAARGPTVRALGDVDAVAAEALAVQGGIAPNDFDAIERAAAEIAAIDRRHAARIDAMQRRLGL
jgi:hypothetical protein